MEDLKNVLNRLEDWEHLSEAKRLETIRSLKKYGSLSLIEPQEAIGKCPFYSFDLRTPCTLSSCSYYVDNGTKHNCVYHTIENQRRKKMTVQEISNTLSITVPEVNGASSSAYKKLKRHLLKEKIAGNVPLFYYIKGHCANCEEYIQDQLDLNHDADLTHEYGKYGWCSYECKHSKPSWQLKLELEFNCQYLYVIKEAYTLVASEKTKNLDKEVDSLLGLPNGTASSSKSLLRELF
jgi:hypothetical protein